MRYSRAGVGRAQLVRQCGLLLAASWVLVTPVASQRNPIPTEATRRLHQVADSFAARVQPAPDGNPWVGFSDSARAAGQARMTWIHQALSGLNPASLGSPEERLLFENIRDATSASLGTAICRGDLWAGTSQFSGWHVAAANWARTQAVGTPAARSQALARLGALPATIAREQARLAMGRDSGVTAAAPVIQAVIAQLGSILPEDPARSPLYAPAQRDTSAAFRSEWRAALSERVYPAARAFSDFLAREYLPRARPEGALALMPNGRACYAATLRSLTSVEVDMDATLRSARQDVTDLLRAAAPLASRLTGERDPSVGIRLLRSDPRYAFPSRDSVLAEHRLLTKRSADRVHLVIANVKPESLAVVPYPEFQERADLPPQYLRAPDDNSRPAQFMVNLARNSRMAAANAVAHEGYPGHHAQRIAARQAPVFHPAMRTLAVSSFSEGWGIYSEELAEVMGLYTTPIDSVGYLAHLLDVAVAAYLDVGYHDRGWTRQQLVDSMVAFGGRTPENAGAYADRHAAMPGQLATYYVGYNAIKELRRSAEQRLGARFDLPAFHWEVLRNGTLTLGSLRAQVDRWLRAKGG
ncbi:MAG: DUF885 domain-containing protein [Gemmatimonadales bacterium]